MLNNLLLISTIVYIMFSHNIILAQEKSTDETLRLDYNTAVWLQRASEETKYSEECFFDVAKHYYIKVLTQDSLHLLANYGLGSLYHNKVVYLQRNIDKNINNYSDDELKKINSELVELLKTSTMYLAKYQELKEKK